MLALNHSRIIYIYLLPILLVSCLGACAGLEPTSGVTTSSSLPYSSPPPAVISSPTGYPTSTPFPISTSTPYIRPSTAPSSPSPASSPTTATVFQLCSPIQDFPYSDLPRIISVGYKPPPKGQDDRHEGVDFCFYRWKDLGPIEGKGVQSVLPGWIAAALDGTFPYGSFIIVETPADLLPLDLQEVLNIESNESLYTVYAHLQDQSLKVHLGQEVSSCQLLGSVGRTGNTYAPHLHFETRIGPQGARFEGMSNFVDSATDVERKNYRLWRISGLYNHFDPMRLLSYNLQITP